MSSATTSQLPVHEAASAPPGPPVSAAPTAPVPAMVVAPSQSSIQNGAEPGLHGAEHGAEPVSEPARTAGTNGDQRSNNPLPADRSSTFAAAAAASDLPPAKIVSDIPGVSQSVTISPRLTPAKMSSLAMTDVSMRSVNGSDEKSPRYPRSPTVQSPASAHAPLPGSASASKNRWTGNHHHQRSIPQSTAVAHTLSSTPTKVPIVDAAPDTGSPAPALTAASGFPSPGREGANQNLKFKDDRTRITYSIRQALPEAARRSVRDNWEKCLIGSDFHQAFILNASLHHASRATIQRGIRDFGGLMVREARNEILDHFTTADLDELAECILSKASVHFLDKALERRLKTIEAKKLINALARAERLGYEPGDVDDEADVAPDHDQSAMAGLAYAHGAQSDDSGAAQNPADGSGGGIVSQALPPTTATGLPLHCGICFRRFTAQSAFDHHMKGKVCTRSPSSPGGFKFNCQHCGQGFTTSMGQQYHNNHKVCGDFGQAPAQKVSPSAVPASTPAIQRVVAMPVPATPTAPNLQTPSSSTKPILSSTPGSTPNVAQSEGSSSDPYAHLSPEQLAALQEELREAEVRYSERMRQASLISDESERKTRLDGLANSFGTKQSLIRKKYGVRLRMRRTKAEIQAERDRMQYKTAAELQAELGFVNTGPGRSIASSSQAPLRNTGSTDGESLKAPRAAVAIGGWAAVNQKTKQPMSTPTSTTILASSLSVPNPKVESRTDVSMHGSKRRHSGAEGEFPQHKRVAYSEMSGLAGPSSTEAETTDPTMNMNPNRMSRADEARAMGTTANPLTLDDSDSDSGDETSDEDIPSQLPPSIRQSLQRSSSAAAPEGSQAGSNSK